MLLQDWNVDKDLVPPIPVLTFPSLGITGRRVPVKVATEQVQLFICFSSMKWMLELGVVPCTRVSSTTITRLKIRSYNSNVYPPPMSFLMQFGVQLSFFPRRCTRLAASVNSYMVLKPAMADYYMLECGC